MSGRPTPGATPPDSRSGTGEAVFGGGCFWCLEAAFQELRGVHSVQSGYAGGHDPNPTYRAVCGGTTGHAEVVRVEYDPSVVSYEALLEVFFAIHDPTTRDRQGADVGPQYRSIILYADEAQRTAAEEAIATLRTEGPWSDPIVTEVVPLEQFFSAEPEHDDYYRRNATQPYCQVVISPKLAKVRRKLARLVQS